jgi:serine/threonine protein kinase
MKPRVPPKPADAQQRDSEAEGASTLVFGGATMLSPGESGSGVRKIEDAKREARQSEPARDEQQVGPYRLVERIGEGAMGYVYRAEHTLIGRVVAIKMLRGELTSNDGCVRRFLAEARAVNLIKHPHIIDVTDFASTPEGRPWFVMELLEGSDLLQAAAHEPLSLPRTLEIVRQLCEALAAVHAGGIVHRDVKPENIFLRQRDGQDFITLLDFGIARLPDPVSADPLQEGLMGTSYYMAPEQASVNPIDHRADLYAVGSVLFELVAGVGRTPFRAEHLQEQLLQVMMAPPPRLSDRAFVPDVVRRDLDLLLERLLAKDPSKRPSSASEVAGELTRIAKKLDAASSVVSPPISTPISTPMLHASDAMVPPPSVIEPRKRARRAAHTHGEESAFWAIVLSAIVALAAVWFATREADWAQAIARALAGDDGAAKPSHGSEHTVEPMRSASDTPAPPAAAQPGGSVPDAKAAPSALPVGKEVGKIGDDSRKRDARQARRATRAKPRKALEAGRELEARPTSEAIISEQPALTIEPAAATPPPPPEPPVVDDPSSIDRDVVLDPFDR